MQPIVFKALLISLLLLSVSHPVEAQLRSLQKKFEKSQETYEHYVGTGNEAKLKSYNNDLRLILDKLRGNESAGSVYLQAIIHHKKVQIQRERQEIGASKNRGLNSLNNVVQQARLLLSKYPRARRQTACDELSTGSNPLALNCEVFQSSLDRLQFSVEQTESYIYEHIVKLPTIALLERYLLKYDFDRVSGKPIQSSQGATSIEALFDLYTLDGHTSTLNQFDRYMQRFPEEHRGLLYQALKKTSTYRNRTQMAGEGEQLLKQGILIASPKRYEDFIKRAAPTGLAFTALQRLLTQPNVTGNPSLQQSILQEYAPYFCSDRPLHRSACQRFQMLQSTLAVGQRSGPSFELADIVGDVDRYYPQHQVKLHFSRNDQYFTILPQQGFADIHQFQLNGTTSQFVGTVKEKTQANINYRYSHKAREPEGTIIAEQQKIYFLGASCLDSFNNDFLLNSDFFIDERQGIAFFVSKSAYQRRLVDPNKLEYNSIWAIDPSQRFQEYTGGYYFNGKHRGNANTDIYYSLKTPGTDNWSCPTHLGPVVNTRYSERSPILIDNTLYFASEGHGGLGGFDIFSVSIFREGSRLRVTQVKNEAQLNSPADELYYQRAFLAGQQFPSYFISTNRKDPQGFYKLYQVKMQGAHSFPPPATSPSSISPPVTSPTSRPRPPLPPPQNLVATSTLELDLQCSIKQNPPPTLGRGRLQLEGTVNVPTDDPKAVMRLGGATIHLSWPGMRSDTPLQFITDKYGFFETQVPIRDDKGQPIPYWNVLIHKEYKNRIVNFGVQVEDLSELCGNANYAYKDYLAEEIDRIERFDIPYFFEFDDYVLKNQINRGILGKYRQIYEQYARVFSKDQSNRRFIVVAYADTLGTSQDNKWLSGKRADGVRQQLIDWGIPADRISTFAFGETTRFSHQVEAPPVLFPNTRKLTGPPVFSPRQKIIHQLNRRAEVVFCSSQYSTDRECLEYHGLLSSE